MDRAFFATLSDVARAAIAAELERGLVADNKLEHGFDPVTEADRAAERALRGAIEAAFPDHGIWGEEYGWTREGAATVWSLDPVDGTRALVCGLPSWAVLVGLLEGDRHIGGMIDLPALNETLVGIDGETRRNGERVRSSGCTALADARLSTTDPHLFAGPEWDAFERVRSASRVTRFGLDAMAYARVATGDIDLVVENSLKRHDYDALIAVVRGAGGHVGDWQGGSDFAPGRIVAAASRSLYDQAVEVLNG
ncbi:inositol monophosphatase family protein [Sphingomonas jaspsi]|uniref:inositol monophosphatase family protein n=1 Tax=Sphingomonas jaspsi TaxID=392409 RepID=UPI0004B010E6|nr:inositol monophosphatase family protein [Sphingomonas jaspsi]